MILLFFHFLRLWFSFETRHDQIVWTRWVSIILGLHQFIYFILLRNLHQVSFVVLPCRWISLCCPALSKTRQRFYLQGRLEDVFNKVPPDKVLQFFEEFYLNYLFVHLILLFFKGHIVYNTFLPWYAIKLQLLQLFHFLHNYIGPTGVRLELVS